MFDNKCIIFQKYQNQKRVVETRREAYGHNRSTVGKA